MLFINFIIFYSLFLVPSLCKKKFEKVLKLYIYKIIHKTWNIAKLCSEMVFLAHFYITDHIILLLTTQLAHWFCLDSLCFDPFFVWFVRRLELIELIWVAGGNGTNEEGEGSERICKVYRMFLRTWTIWPFRLAPLATDWLRMREWWRMRREGWAISWRRNESLQICEGQVRA